MSSQGRRVFQSAVALTTIQLAGYVAPLVVIPFLIRTIGVAGWGKVAFAHSLAIYIGIVVEFGFSYSGTAAVARLAARGRNGDRELGRLLLSVGLVKLGISVVVVLLAILARPLAPLLREDTALFAAFLGYGLLHGYGLAWFYHGMEWMRLIAILEVGGKVLSTVLIVLLVRSPGDEWLVIGLYALASGLVLTGSYVFAFRRVGFGSPDLSSVREAFREGWWTFVFRVTASVYSLGGPILLGLFRPAVEVGQFAAADRLMRAVVGLMRPISQALFPRISSLLQEDPAQAERVHIVATVGIVCGSVLVAGSAWLFTGPIMALVFGETTPQAEQIFRILVAVIPAAAISNALGVQWLIPTGRARTLSTVVAAVGLVTAGAGVMAATYDGVMTFSGVIVGGEWLVAVGLAIVVASGRRRERAQPLAT